MRNARQNGHKIVTFTKRSDSTLAQMSDIVFVVDGSRQTLAGSLPNTFFGHVILAFEELVAFTSPERIADKILLFLPKQKNFLREGVLY